MWDLIVSVPDHYLSFYFEQFNHFQHLFGFKNTSSHESTHFIFYDKFCFTDTTFDEKISCVQKWDDTYLQTFLVKKAIFSVPYSP